MITVRLFATFRENRFNEKDFDFPDSRPLADLLNQLRISSRQVGILLVNGNSATPDTLLHNADTVSIFPAIGGG
jgi:molybdopterin converting factor small subunit